MSITQDWWYKNPEAPFYDLMRAVSGYLHPEAGLEDELVEVVQMHPEVEWVSRFKEQLRASLLDPSQIPDGALYRAASYDDGNDVRFLRRLWRDLYPTEPVPGGDDEFRKDLRKLINGDVDRVPSTVDYYGPIPLPSDPEELKALGRQVWQRFYPDEPLPE